MCSVTCVASCSWDCGIGCPTQMGVKLECWIAENHWSLKSFFVPRCFLIDDSNPHIQTYGTPTRTWLLYLSITLILCNKTGCKYAGEHFSLIIVVHGESTSHEHWRAFHGLSQIYHMSIISLQLLEIFRPIIYLKTTNSSRRAVAWRGEE